MSGESRNGRGLDGERIGLVTLLFNRADQRFHRTVPRYTIQDSTQFPGAVMDLVQVAALVQQVAEEEVSTRFTRVASRQKADGSLITEADTAVQSRLMSALGARWLDIPLLGEEMEPKRQRAVMEEGRAFWCLDPLDGTTNFSAGLPFFAVSLALIREGRVEAGIVYDPQRHECFSAERGGGAWLNGETLAIEHPPAELGECIALIDYKRLRPHLIERLAAQPPYRSGRSLGAVALEWCWMAAGRCHIYLHGRQNLWDYAAGSLVLAEAGGVVCLTDRPEEACGQELRLGAKVGVGAVSLPLFHAWRSFITG